MRESIEKFIDDPVKVMAPITFGTAALYAFFADAMPEHSEMTIALGSANFALNTACWIKFARDRNNITYESEANDEQALFVDETT